MSDETPVEQPGGRMTRDDLVQRLVDLQREIGSTANGAHCYGVWARRIGEIIAALAAPPAAPSADLVALVREMECPNCGETAARADLNGHFHDGDALASPPQEAAPCIGRDPLCPCRIREGAAESAWLIERDIDSTLHYWTGRVIGGREIGAWSPNHLDARRFARREDAACMLTWHCDGNGRVAEHIWTPAAPRVPQRALSDALTGGALGRIREGANSDTGRSDAVAGTNDCPVQRREAGDPDALVGHGGGDGARRGADPGDPLLVSEESGRREAAGDAVTSRGVPEPDEQEPPR